MNSNQRSQGNNQSDNGGNEKSVSSSRGGTVEQSPQPGTVSGSQQAGQQQAGQAGSMQSGSQRSASIGSQQGAQTGQQSTDRSGSQTGSEQQGQAAQRQSNDAAGGLPRSPGGKHLAADQDMDDDTGLSNRGNRQSAEEIDDGTKQEKQSNVGRRDDMTPD